MKNGIRFRLSFVFAASLFAIQITPMMGSSPMLCYSTPHSALEALAAGAAIAAELPNGESKNVEAKNGYRVSTIKLDPVLGLRWAMIANCAHPEWPAFAVSANATSLIPVRQTPQPSPANSAKAVPVVRAGESVRLWWQGNLCRFDVAAVSEENGGLGKTIRVRLLHRATEEQSAPQQFFGIVRGPSDVEMQPR
jgi:hypothetical protein